MKRKYFIVAITTFLLLFVLTSKTYATNDDDDEKVGMDTIIKVEGKVMIVDVVNVTTTYVRFKIPDNDELYTIPRKEVHKIIYSNGRVEEFYPMVIVSLDETDWQSVWITKDKKDVADLYKRGKIKAQALPSSRSPKAAKKNAIIILQKKAAALGATTVLITEGRYTGNYGEPQGYFVEGIAYGTEPLEEEGLNED